MTTQKTFLGESDAYLQRALLYAFRLVEKMEASAPASQLLFVPSVVVWANDQLKPDLLQSLRETAKFDDFLGCLELYRALRPAAEEIRFENFDDACAEMCVAAPDDGYVTPTEMLQALENNSHSVADASQLAHFERALRQVDEYRLSRRGSAKVRSAVLPSVVHYYSADVDLDMHMPVKVDDTSELQRTLSQQ